MVNVRDEAFKGRIGKTVEESEPWWPEPPAPPRAVAERRDDRARRHRASPTSAATARRSRRRTSTGSRPSGLRYTNFHTTALCSPSRACLLTGRNHHAVGMRGVSNWDTGFPHMRGGITPARRDRCRRCCGRTATPPTPPASGTWRRWRSARRRARTRTGRCRRASTASTGSCRARPTSSIPSSPSDNHHIDPPRPARGRLPRQRGHRRPVDRLDPRPRSRCGPTGRSSSTSRSARRTRRTRRRASTSQKWRGRVRRGLGRVRASGGSRASSRWASCPPGTTLAPPQPGRAARGTTSPTNQQRVRGAPAGGVRRVARAHRRRRSAGWSTSSKQRGLLDNTLLMVLSDNGAQPGGRPVRRDGRVQLLQRHVGGHRRDRRQPPRRHRRAALAQQLSRGVGRRPATRRCAGTSRTPTAAACAIR